NSLDVTQIVAGFDAAGFDADGSIKTGADTSGFSLDLGEDGTGTAYTTIADAVTNGTLKVVREDGQSFTASESLSPDAFDGTNATQASFAGTASAATSTAPGLTLSTGDFSVQVGDGEAVEIVGTFETQQDLADAINSQVSGAFAQIKDTGE